MKEISSEEKHQRRKVLLALLGTLVLLVATPTIVAVWYVTGAIHNRALAVLGFVLIVTLYVTWMKLWNWAVKR